MSSTREACDTIGAVYMLTAYKKHSGQYFTPWNIAQLMAQMTIQDGAQEITDRLRQAQRAASARDDANSHLLAATILAGLAVPEERSYTTYFLTRILPLIAADFDPITICDPCCGAPRGALWIMPQPTLAKGGKRVSRAGSVPQRY